MDSWVLWDLELERGIWPWAGFLFLAVDDTWISLAWQMLAPELLCDNSLCRAKAGKHMKPLLFGKNDLINAKAYIDAGPAALAITLQKLQAALDPEQPIVLLSLIHI